MFFGLKAEVSCVFVMRKTFYVLLVAVLLFSGCVQQEKTGQQQNGLPAETGTDTGQNTLSEQISEADVPIIEENDTVEIGEMI